MLALALDNFQLVVIDVDIQRIVRLFAGHTNTITDLVTDLICKFMRHVFAYCNRFINQKSQLLTVAAVVAG